MMKAGKYAGKSLDAHEQYTEAYVNILNTYKDQIAASVTKKNDLKDKFFSVIKFIMIILMFLFVISVIASFVLFGMMIGYQYQSVAVITGAITAMISSFSTMIISIFKLPKIIADYLFNKEEDQLMNEIIKNIQKYEIDAVKLEQEARVDAEKDKAAVKKNDLPMKSSPNLDGRQPKNSSPSDIESK